MSISLEQLSAQMRRGEQVPLRHTMQVVLTLSIPSILQQIVVTAVEYIDAAMVGHIGASATASIGIVSSSTWLMHGMLAGLYMSFAIQVAQYLGADRQDDARGVLRQSMIFNLVVGLAAAAFGIGISRFLPGWLGADPSLQADASAYFAIWSASLPFLMIMGTYSSMLRSSGDALTPGLISVLTCVLGASSGEGTGIGGVLIQTALFFLVAVGIGLVIHYAMKWLDARNPHTQRITIVSIAFCFAMAYIAEQYFGIADITGAYIAGIVLCTMQDAPYVERRVDISNYVIFAPVFFASIGLKTDISGLTPEIFLFCICFVLVALLTKIIGCGLAARVCRFNWGDSLKVGVGMMTRGEVALIVAQKGLEVGVVDPVYFTAVILLIVVSSVATPLVLKALFTKMPPVAHPSEAQA